MLKDKHKVVTVWLESSYSEDDSDYDPEMFFCIKCRSPVFQYVGDVIRIVSGNHPYEPKSIHKCKGNYRDNKGGWHDCNMYYSIMGVTQRESEKEE